MIDVRIDTSHRLQLDQGDSPQLALFQGCKGLTEAQGVGEALRQPGASCALYVVSALPFGKGFRRCPQINALSLPLTGDFSLAIGVPTPQLRLRLDFVQ